MNTIISIFTNTGSDRERINAFILEFLIKLKGSLANKE